MSSVITKIIAAKSGDKQFVLRNESGEWLAAIGGKSDSVSLCEALDYGDYNAEFSARADNPDDAISQLYDMIVGVAS